MALLPQLHKGSFCTITVITAQTLTWAAAAGRRWRTIKPLPSDTPPGPHSSKQLSALPLQQPTCQPVCPHLKSATSLDLLLTCLFYSLPHCVFTVSKSLLSGVCCKFTKWLAPIQTNTNKRPTTEDEKCLMLLCRKEHTGQSRLHPELWTPLRFVQLSLQ